MVVEQPALARGEGLTLGARALLEVVDLQGAEVAVENANRRCQPPGCGLEVLGAIDLVLELDARLADIGEAPALWQLGENEGEDLGQAAVHVQQPVLDVEEAVEFLGPIAERQEHARLALGV